MVNAASLTPRIFHFSFVIFHLKKMMLRPSALDPFAPSAL
jgi:hypothetical protein